MNTSLEGAAEDPIHTHSFSKNRKHSHYVNAYYNGQITDC